MPTITLPMSAAGKAMLEAQLDARYAVQSRITGLAQRFQGRARQAAIARDQPMIFDRYVDAVNGLDSNAGSSPSAAWQTLAKVASSATVGQRIGLLRGSTQRVAATFTVPVDNLIFGAYGRLTDPLPKIKASLDCSGLSWSVFSGSIYQATKAGMSAANGKMAWIDEDTPLVKVGSTGAMTAGTVFPDTVGNVLYVWLSNSADPTGRHLELANSSVAVTDQKIGTVWQDIKICHAGSFAYIKQPTIGSNGGALRRCEIGPSCGPGVNWSQTIGGVIEDCWIHDNWAGGVYPAANQGYGLSIGSSTDGLEVRFNRFARNYEGLITGTGTTHRNLSIHHNQLWLQKVNGVSMYGGVAGFGPEIFHNFVYHSPDTAGAVGHGIVTQSAVVGPKWRNNLVISDYAGTPTNVQLYCLHPDNASLPGTDVDYNLGWQMPGSTLQYGKQNTTLYATFTLWRAALVAAGFAGAEAHGVNADPLIANLAGGDFSVLTGSPAIDAGQILGYPGEVYAGAAPDMGAWEVA